MKFIFLVFTVFFLGLGAISYSQDYKHYTVKDGLPSSEVYSTFQDSKGYIWFATDAGVSRFNGYTFKNFDVKNGLTDNTVFLIREDSKGRIWFGTFNKKLCYYYNDSIYAFSNNDKIAKLINQGAILGAFAIDESDNLWLGFSTSGIIKCSFTGNVEMKTKNIGNQLLIYEIGDELVWSINQMDSISIKTLKSKKEVYINYTIEYHSENDEVCKGRFMYKFSLDKKTKSPINFLLGKEGHNAVFFLSDSVLFFKVTPKCNQTKPISISHLFKNRILSTCYFDGFLWVCVDNEGVYKIYNYNDKLIIREKITVSKSPSRIFKDKIGGIWITTLNDGVYYLKSKVFKNEDLSLEFIEVDTIHNSLYLATNDRKLFKRSSLSNKSPLKHLLICDEKPNVLLFDYFDNGLFLDGISGKLSKLFVNGNYKKFDVGQNQTKAMISDSNVIVRVNSNGISQSVNGKEVYYSSVIQNKHWCTSLVKDDKNILVGTNKGLIIYNPVTFTIEEPFKKHEVLSTSITCLAKFKDNVILVGTKSFGLIFMQNKKIIGIINKNNGLLSDLVRGLHVDNQNEIWVGTNLGLSKIQFVSRDNYNVRNITTKHGLISEEISQIKTIKNKVYLVTPKHLIEFDKTLLSINVNPDPIYFSKVEVNANERELKGTDNYEFEHFENIIKIYYESLSYRSLGDINYKYRLLDVDTNWQNTTRTDIEFYALPSGKYKFEVMSQNEDGYWGMPISLEFIIHPPIWYTWWFIGLEALLVLFIVVFIFRYRENQLKNTSKNLQIIADNEKRIIELELKALKSQMNPHFIFNTLNSIQDFISSNDFKASNRYISNFSKLIRTVLNHSDKNTITLREETEMLELYLNLEQIRFSNKFNYKIIIDDELDLDFDKIPPMLIQPFIENAIWHGLMNNTTVGLIEIMFKLEEDNLICIVRDNGIGRQAADKIKASRIIKNKSIGITVTKERLNFINDELLDNFNLVYIDLFDENNKPSGTEVRITIKIN